MIENIRKNLDIHMLWFAILVITIGTLYLHLVPNNEIPDATSHFATSYALANKLMGQESNLASGDARGVKGMRTVNMAIRECDETLFIPDSEEKDQGGALFTNKVGNIYLEYTIHTYFPFPTYIIDAIAIIFGRLIHLSSWALLNLVRYVNLFIYVVLGILTLKIFPLGKDLMSVVFLLPAGIQRASAASHESLYYAFVWFYIALVLHMAYEMEKLEIKEMLLLFLCSVLIAPIKGLGIGYVLLIFLVKREKLRIKNKWGKNSLLLIFMFCAAIWLLYNLMVNNPENIISSNNGARFIEYADSEAVYLTDLLKNPVYFIGIIIRTFVRWGVYFTETLVSLYGRINMGGGNGIFAYAFATLFVISSFLTECDQKEINTKGRLWIAGVFLFIYGLQCILTIFSFGGTDGGYGTVKGSYMMPCIPLLGLMIKGKFLRYYRSNRTFIIMTAETVVHIMALCYILF